MHDIATRNTHGLEILLHPSSLGDLLQTSRKNYGTYCSPSYLTYLIKICTCLFLKYEESPCTVEGGLDEDMMSFRGGGAYGAFAGMRG